MKARLLIAPVLALAVAAALWKWLPPDGKATPKPGADRPAATTTAPPRPALPPRVLRDNDVPAPAPGAEAAVMVGRDQALADVNGVAITLRDLMPVEPGAPEPYPIDPAMLRFLLDRAVDRELVKQAAGVAGVTLDAAQQQQLAEVRDQLARPADPDAVELTRTPAYVDFDVRDTEGLMLQTNLVAQAGGPSPHVTRAVVDDYYQAHQTEFPALPADAAERAKAWGSIEATIRGQLAVSQREQHGAAVAAYMGKLRSRAQIRESELVAGRR